jgi:hypothetical protein
MSDKEREVIKELSEQELFDTLILKLRTPILRDKLRDAGMGDINEIVYQIALKNKKYNLWTF